MIRLRQSALYWSRCSTASRGGHFQTRRGLWSLKGFRVSRLRSSSFFNEGLKRNYCLYRPHSQIAKQMFSCNNILFKSESSASSFLEKKIQISSEWNFLSFAQFAKIFKAFFSNCAASSEINGSQIRHPDPSEGHKIISRCCRWL